MNRGGIHMSIERIINQGFKKMYEENEKLSEHFSLDILKPLLSKLNDDEFKKVEDAIYELITEREEIAFKEAISGVREAFYLTLKK